MRNLASPSRQRPSSATKGKGGEDSAVRKTLNFGSPRSAVKGKPAEESAAKESVKGTVLKTASKAALRNPVPEVKKTVSKAEPSSAKKSAFSAKAPSASPAKSIAKAPSASPAKATALTKTTRVLRKRRESDWTWNEKERVYTVGPQRPDVHKNTFIYLHYASGHPNEYFEVAGFESPGLRVILPKAPIFRSLHYGEDGVKTSRSRLWYDYYYDPDDKAKEDPHGLQGADAEQLWDCGESSEDEDKDSEDEDEEEEEEAGDGKKAKKEKPPKFSEFIKTVKPDAHPEMNVPKEAQVKMSIDRVLALIHKEAEALGGDYSRIFLGGWSQGAVLAPLVALHKDCPPLGGVLSICGTIHNDMVDEALKQPLKPTPLVFIVGVKDDYYPVMLLKPMIDRLQAGGFNVELREKPMDHCLNGQIGCPNEAEERWIRQFIEGFFENASLGALLNADAASSQGSQPSVTLDAKDQEAAMKVIYGILFGDKVPHNRKAEIMKHSCWEAAMSELNKRVNKLSADDLTLVAKFFGAETCAAADLARFLATPTQKMMAALRSGVAPMDCD